MKIKTVLLILFSLVLFIFSYYSNEWSKEFVDPCCSGLCGRCPPSFWECSLVGSMATIQITIGVALLILATIELFEDMKK